MTELTFETRSKARVHARDLGLDPAKLNFDQDPESGTWSYSAPETEAAEVSAPAVSDATPGWDAVDTSVLEDAAEEDATAPAGPAVLLVDPDGGDYGMVAADKARETAEALAAAEGCTVQAVNPESQEVLWTVEPPAPEPAPVATFTTASNYDPAPAADKPDEAPVNDEAEADGSPAQLAAQGPVVLTIEGTFEREHAGEVAKAVAKLLGENVSIRTLTLEVIEVVAPPRKRRKAGDPLPEKGESERAAQRRRATEVCLRPEGATVWEIGAAAGWATLPKPEQIENIATKAGYVLEVRDGRHFFRAPPAPAAKQHEQPQVEANGSVGTMMEKHNAIVSSMRPGDAAAAMHEETGIPYSECLRATNTD